MSNTVIRDTLAPGFDDPVFDSQSVFRGILEALSRPGRIVTINPCPAAPSPLPAAMAAALLCLADMDTPVWLDTGAARPTVKEYLAFHCGTPLIATPGQAKFAVVTDAAEMPALTTFNGGDDLYPDRSTTILVAAAGFGRGTKFDLSGPGIESRQCLAIDGLPDWFPAAWEANRRGYPTGVDILLCAGNTVVGLPRSTTLELALCM